MKVIVAGGRDFKDYKLLKETLDNFQQECGIITEIISGGARGSDKLGEQYANENSIHIKRFVPDWKGLGKKAGFVRNRQMGDYAKEHNGMLVAFWDKQSKGTKGMIEYANKIGLKCVVVYYNAEVSNDQTN